MLYICIILFSYLVIQCRAGNIASETLQKITDHRAEILEVLNTSLNTPEIHVNKCKNTAIDVFSNELERIKPNQKFSGVLEAIISNLKNLKDPKAKNSNCPPTKIKMKQMFLKDLRMFLIRLNRLK